MKINMLSIIVVFFINSCTTSAQNYEGFIYKSKEIPFGNIKICEKSTNNCTQTDSKGFFKLKKNKDSINDLIVFYNNLPVDTIKTPWKQHGEKINYSFIKGKKDTLFIDVK